MGDKKGLASEDENNWEEYSNLRVQLFIWHYFPVC